MYLLLAVQLKLRDKCFPNACVPSLYLCYSVLCAAIKRWVLTATTTSIELLSLKREIFTLCPPEFISGLLM